MERLSTKKRRNFAKVRLKNGDQCNVYFLTMLLTRLKQGTPTHLVNKSEQNKHFAGYDRCAEDFYP